jgi:hypothetical protein
MSPFQVNKVFISVVWIPPYIANAEITTEEYAILTGYDIVSPKNQIPVLWRNVVFSSS